MFNSHILILMTSVLSYRHIKILQFVEFNSDALLRADVGCLVIYCSSLALLLMLWFFFQLLLILLAKGWGALYLPRAS